MNKSEEALAKALPPDYGEVCYKLGSRGLPEEGGRIGLVMPTYRRPDYLRACLASLGKSDLENVILCIVDESEAEGLPQFDRYRLFGNMDSPGFDIRRVRGSVQEIKQACDCEPECLGFNTSGWLKHRILPSEELVRYAVTEVGLYVKDESFRAAVSERRFLDRSQTASMIRSFDIGGAPLVKIFKRKHGNMNDSLLAGWDLMKDAFNCRYLCCLDSDTLVEENWLNRILSVHRSVRNDLHHPFLVVTGFNTGNHPILSEHPDYYIKASLGGVNLFFHSGIYRPVVRKALDDLLWDQVLVERMRRLEGDLICTKPSVVQHIGKVGMWSNRKHFDVAEDFSPT